MQGAAHPGPVHVLLRVRGRRGLRQGGVEQGVGGGRLAPGVFEPGQPAHVPQARRALQTVCAALQSVHRQAHQPVQRQVAMDLTVPPFGQPGAVGGVTALRRGAPLRRQRAAGDLLAQRRLEAIGGRAAVFKIALHLQQAAADEFVQRLAHGGQVVVVPHPGGAFGKEREGKHAQGRQAGLHLRCKVGVAALEGGGKGDVMPGQPALAGAGQFVLPVVQEVFGGDGAHVVLAGQQRNRQRVSLGGALDGIRQVGVRLALLFGFCAVRHEQRLAGLFVQPGQGVAVFGKEFLVGQPGRLLAAGEQQPGAAVGQIGRQTLDALGLGQPFLDALQHALVVVQQPQPVPLRRGAQDGLALLSFGLPGHLARRLLAVQRRQQRAAQPGGADLAGKRVGAHPLAPAPGEALGKRGRQGGLAHAARTDQGDDPMSARELVGEAVQFAVAPQQRAGRADLAAQLDAPRPAQTHLWPAGEKRQGRLPGAGGGVTHRQSNHPRVGAQAPAHLAQRLAIILPGQQAVVQRHRQVVAELVQKSAVHAQGKRDAVERQGARQVGLCAAGGMTGAQHDQTQGAARRQGEQVTIAQRLRGAVGVFQEQHRHRAVAAALDAAVTGQVQDGRAAAQCGLQRLRGGRDAPRRQALAAVFQHGANGRHFVIQPEAIPVARPAGAVHQRVGGQRHKVERSGRGGGGRARRQAQQPALHPQELAAGQRGKFPGHGVGRRVAVQQQQVVGVVLQTAQQFLAAQGGGQRQAAGKRVGLRLPQRGQLVVRRASDRWRSVIVGGQSIRVAAQGNRDGHETPPGNAYISPNIRNQYE